MSLVFRSAIGLRCPSPPTPGASTPTPVRQSRLFTEPASSRDAAARHNLCSCICPARRFLPAVVALLHSGLHHHLPPSPRMYARLMHGAALTAQAPVLCWSLGLSHSGAGTALATWAPSAGCARPQAVPPQSSSPWSTRPPRFIVHDIYVSPDLVFDRIDQLPAHDLLQPHHTTDLISRLHVPSQVPRRPSPS